VLEELDARRDCSVKRRDETLSEKLSLESYCPDPDQINRVFVAFRHSRLVEI